MRFIVACVELQRVEGVLRELRERADFGAEGDVQRLNIIKGFAVQLTPEAKAFLEAHPDVDYIEADGVATIDTQ